MADRLLHVGPPGEMRTLFRTDARQDSPRASTSEVLLNGVLGGLLQETRRGGIDSGGIGIAHRRFPENRRIRGTRRQISPDKARVPFIGLIELQIGASRDRLRQGEP